MELLNVLELLDITQTFERKINLALRYAGLRLPLYRAMVFLNTSGKITVSDLSRHFNVSRATTSVLVNQLLKAGVIETIENRSDKRSFYIKLTVQGERRLAVAKNEVSIVVRNISSEFSEASITALNSLTGKIIKQN